MKRLGESNKKFKDNETACQCSHILAANIVECWIISWAQLKAYQDIQGDDYKQNSKSV